MTQDNESDIDIQTASNDVLLEDIIEEYRTIFENVDVGIIKGKIESDADISFINECALDMIGYTRQQYKEELGDKISNFTLTDDMSIFNKDISNTGAPIRFETCAKRRDGEIIWLLGTVTIAEDEQYEKVGIYTFRNIKKYMALKEELLRLELLMGNIIGGILIYEYEEEFTISYVSGGFLRLLGYSREEFDILFQNSHSDLLFAEDKEYIENKIRSEIDKHGKYTIEYRLKKKEGNTIWVVDKGTLTAVENDKQMIQSILTDITLQKETEEALKISDKRYEIALGFSDVTIFDYNIITKQMTHHWSDIETYNLPPIMENAVETIIDLGIIQKNSVKAFKEFYKKIEDGAPFSETVIHTIEANGKESAIEMRLVSIFDDSGRPVRAVGVKRDITRTMFLNREMNNGNTLVSNRLLAFEANISKDIIISYNHQWAEKLNITDVGSLLGTIKNLSENLVSPEHRTLFIYNTDRDYIMSEFIAGHRLISFEFRMKADNNEYQWFEEMINIFKEEDTEDIHIRCYITNINNRKENELKAFAHQRYYEGILTKCSIVYEMNITKDIVVSGIAGHQNRVKGLYIPQTNIYTDMMISLYKNVIYKEDRARFIELFMRENVLSYFEKGGRELIYEYRRPDDTGKFVWVRYTLHLFENPQSRDITGFSYVEVIDEEKKKEQALIYMSEHDSLTGFYNKSATEDKVNAYLNSVEGISGKHIFFIVDLDYFKAINDNFGHAFGDAVLSQVSTKIKALFRDEDILGRIGGDEFIILMKNIREKSIAVLKANEIRKGLAETYIQNGIEYKISVSIGIAYYNEHGKNYEELYNHSDMALYYSKNNGRNQFSVYNSDLTVLKSNEKGVEATRLVPTKKFDDNIVEYIFRILYESSDKKASINAVLKLIGGHYNVSRVYIFENSHDGKSTSNTFEWCSKGVTSHRINYQNIRYHDLYNYREKFNEEGIYYIGNTENELSGSIQKFLPDSVKSCLQFSITKDSKFIGFIGFDQYGFTRKPTKTELSDLRNISNVLGVFIMEMRAVETSIESKQAALSIVNGLNSYAYVCDPHNFKVLFINDKTMELSPNSEVGDYCYKTFWNRDFPCEACPMKKLKESDESKCVMELYNTKFNIWIRTTASWIDWIKNKKVCLVDSVDVTEYK